MTTTCHLPGVTKDERRRALSFSTGRRRQSLHTSGGRARPACDGIQFEIRKPVLPGRKASRLIGRQLLRGVAAVTLWKPILPAPDDTGGVACAMAMMGIDRIRAAIAMDFRSTEMGGRERDAQIIASAMESCGRAGTIIGPVADWHFDGLSPRLIRAGGRQAVLEFPIGRSGPAAHWSFGQVKLMATPAHPMVTARLNGAGQSIIDARAMVLWRSRARRFRSAALASYEGAAPGGHDAHRCWTNPLEPAGRDHARSVFQHPRPAVCPIEDVISRDELVALSEGYKRIAVLEGSLVKGTPAQGTLRAS